MSEQNKTEASPRLLEIPGAISRWDEALPLGNGLTGCLIWGDGSPLRFSLDRGDLWDNRQAPEAQAADYTYANLIELVRTAQWDEIRRRYQYNSKSATPTKIPAGRIELNWGAAASHMENRLRFDDACAEVKLQFGAGTAQVWSFLHAEQNTGHIRATGHRADQLEAGIVPPAFCEPSEAPNALSRLGYPEPELKVEEDVHLYLQRTCEDLEFAVLLARRSLSPDETEFVFTIASSHDGSDWLEAAKARLAAALEQGFDACLASHRRWWNGYWSKSDIRLPDVRMEQLWRLNTYLLGSCSRKHCPPMPLQGVWTADEGLLPPWKGDYHHDLNTQMCYWHYMKANHLEEGESFLDYLWELKDKGRSFARSFYDAPGLNMPSVMSQSGDMIGGWAMYSTSLTNQIWLCQAFDHYWLYTGDEEFLRDRAYPYFKESAACVMRWLEPGEDGMLRLPLSSSPEVHDDRPEAWLTPNSNYDQALLIYMFEALTRMAEELGLAKEAAEWRGYRGQLAELAVDERGVLKLSPDEWLQASHRHFGQLMALYPLKLIDWRQDDRQRAVYDASMRDLVRLGTGWWVGFSFSWMAGLYANRGNGEGALAQLRLFYDYFCSVNGFNLNGDYKQAGLSVYDYRPFTLEANMGAADALQEMLLHTSGDQIRLFPAIPAEWRGGSLSFRNLRGDKGVLVSAEWKDGALISVELRCEREIQVRLHQSFGTDMLEQHSAGSTHRLHCPAGGWIELRLSPAQPVRICAQPI